MRFFRYFLRIFWEFSGNFMWIFYELIWISSWIIKDLFTLKKLLEHTSFYSEFLTVQGGDYIREFLLTYPYVTTPELFLEQLQRLYNFVCPEDGVPEVMNYFETNRKAIQQKWARVQVPLWYFFQFLMEFFPDRGNLNLTCDIYILKCILELDVIKIEPWS